MTAPPGSPPVARDGEPADGQPAAPACPCGSEMWFLPFGYDSWVCRRNTRHWFRPGGERWSRDALALSGDPG
jgi:hypothetical protein